MDDKKVSSITEKAKFYERESLYIENLIFNKLKDCEVFINNKSNSVRMIRLENHQYLKKLSSL